MPALWEQKENAIAKVVELYFRYVELTPTDPKTLLKELVYRLCYMMTVKQLLKWVEHLEKKIAESSGGH